MGIKKEEIYPLIRHIRRWGKRSFEIGIPITWVTGNGLRETSPVKIDKNGDGNLVVSPVMEEK